ncbi:MAG: dienelactone hydrolase family protein [Pseudomonadota bacterium]|nr:dienelactone hydrolase family protein [Pseudomonadota bacterium]
MRYAIALFAALAWAGSAMAEIKTETVEYSHDGARLVGYLAYPADVRNPRPGVLVVPEWWGLNDYARQRAEQLAQLGYVALAADIYGDGKVAADPKEAGALAGRFRGDRALLRTRTQAGLEALKAQSGVDPSRLAAIGYCFGGTAVLELARGGAAIAGVVSFHGGLDTPSPDASAIKTPVLALHGADDPHVPPEQVLGFMEEMRKAGADWQLVAYGNAVHGFTNPNNGEDNSRGVAYNAAADRRSWQDMQQFFDAIFEP